MLFVFQTSPISYCPFLIDYGSDFCSVAGFAEIEGFYSHAPKDFKFVQIQDSSSFGWTTIGQSYKISMVS